MSRPSSLARFRASLARSGSSLGRSGSRLGRSGSALGRFGSRLGRSGSPLARDAALGLALALVAFVPPLATHGTRLGELPHRPVDALAVAAALAQSLPLAMRRRWPAATLAVVAAGFAVQELRGYATFASVGLLVAIYSAAAYQVRFRRWTAVCASSGFAALAVGLHLLGSTNRVADYVVFYLMLAAGWLLGVYVRTLRSTAALRRRAEAEAARADERARIARELHDVVTHHVTAMVVQANAAQFLPLDPARSSLTAISSTGKQALGDLRELLGVLDPARSSPLHPGHPGLTALPSLIEQTREAGQPVSLIEEGSPPESLGTGRELTAYRVVQESLTNALKYATGLPTVVRLGYHPSSLDISVTTAASGPAVVNGSGRGLAGLRERVELFGGTLSAGPSDDGGFTVAAHLPAAGESA